MEFVINNYIWFAVAGVILLMAFIGFIAEKTDFGRKEFEKKIRPAKEPKPKKEKGKKELELELLEEIKLEEATPLIEEPIDQSFEEIKIEEDLTVPLSDDSWGQALPEMTSSSSEEITFEEPVMETEEITFEEPITETEEITFEEPITETEEITFEEPVMETEEITFEEPVMKTEEVTFEEPIMETEENDFPIEQPKIELENLELPSIDSLKEEESDDDVWKF